MKHRKRSELAGKNSKASPGNCPLADTPSSRAILLAEVLIVLAAVVVYSNSFAGAFLFDDTAWILENANIRHPWPIGQILWPTNAGMVGGRPMVSLTLAVNYAISGENVWSYHAMNLIVHVLAALTLFGVVRRTLILPGLRERFGRAATPLALAVALLWAVHPLQTAAVTYVIQRAESMVSLFYLLTLYCVIRGATAGRTLWYVGAVAACLLGMATKEVMATAPAIVFLYDRTFLAGSFREALRRRYGLYAALAATWCVVGLLLASTGFYRGTTGFAVESFTWWSYLLTQPGVIVHYLRLALWPSDLCMDYGWPAARTLGQIAPPAALLLAMLGATVWALVKRPALGFIGACFFVILTPTSSFVPIQDAAFEHRMYLPLAAVATVLVIGFHAAGERLVRRGIVSSRASQLAGVVLVLAVVAMLGIATFHRNEVYHSEVAIWQDAIHKAPNNPRGYYNLGVALAGRGKVDEADLRYREALQLKPDYAEAHNNLGLTPASRGQTDQAMALYQKALAIKPDYAEAHNNLGNALASCGQIDEAVDHYKKALATKPDCADAHNNLGAALARQGRLDDAIAHYREAVKIKPDFAGAYNNLGAALLGRGQTDDAMAQYQKALQLDPNYAEAHYNFGLALASRGQLDAAIAQYLKAVQLKSDYAEAHNNLGLALGGCGRMQEAVVQFEKALAIKPDDAEVYYNLGGALLQERRADRAIAHYRKAVELKPDYADAHNNLAGALLQQGRLDDAIAHYREALKLKPNHPDARHNLGMALSDRERILTTLASRRTLLRARPNDVSLLNETARTLATNPNASIRNGAEAVELARRAAELSGNREPAILDTLAAAYAEAGRFADAVRTASAALELAAQQNNGKLAQSLRVKLLLYQAGTACREMQ